MAREYSDEGYGQQRSRENEQTIEGLTEGKKKRAEKGPIKIRYKGHPRRRAKPRGKKRNKSRISRRRKLRPISKIV